MGVVLGGLRVEGWSFFLSCGGGEGRGEEERYCQEDCRGARVLAACVVVGTVLGHCGFPPVFLVFR